MDADGDLDLATANNWTSTVSVLLNSGDGTYVAPVSYPLYGRPHSVVAADFDADGDSDLAVTNFWSNTQVVSVLKNNGDGTYTSVVNYAVGSQPVSVFAADLDGDGDQDLAVANSGGGFFGSVGVLTNNGNGTFAPVVNYPLSGSPESVCAADLDGDGDRDLAVANYDNGTVSVLKNNGDGTFAAGVSYSARRGAFHVTAADLDGDADQDLAVANRFDISVLKNNGDGTFAAAVTFLVGDDPRSVFAADLD